MMEKLKKAGFVALFILIGAFIYQQSLLKTGSENVDNYYTIKKTNIEQELVLAGEIGSDEKAELKFKTGGKIAWVGVKEGDTVVKGQVLASLDKQELKKALEKDLNDFMIERNDLDQSRDDVEDKAITDAMRRILEKAQYDLNNSIIDVELQNLSMQFANITSPINGIITHVEYPHAGVNVLATENMFEVINPEKLRFEAEIDQTEVVLLKPSMQALISLDAFPGKKINGTLTYISLTPKEGETGTIYEVHVSIDPSNILSQYRIGMSGDVSFLLQEKKDIIAVPLNYVHQDNGKTYVYMKEKQAVRMVKTGIETEDLIEIVSGLKTGDIIMKELNKSS